MVVLPRITSKNSRTAAMNITAREFLKTFLKLHFVLLNNFSVQFSSNQIQDLLPRFCWFKLGLAWHTLPLWACSSFLLLLIVFCRSCCQGQLRNMRFLNLFYTLNHSLLNWDLSSSILIIVVYTYELLWAAATCLILKNASWLDKLTKSVW